MENIVDLDLAKSIDKVKMWRRLLQKLLKHVQQNFEGTQCVHADLYNADV